MTFIIIIQAFQLRLLQTGAFQKSMGEGKPLNEIELELSFENIDKIVNG